MTTSSERPSQVTDELRQRGRMMQVRPPCACGVLDNARSKLCAAAETLEAFQGGTTHPGGCIRRQEKSDGGVGLIYTGARRQR
jgi:hypothetical protein